MSNVTVTSGEITLTLTAAQTAKITNLDITTINIQFSLALTSNLKQLMVRSRVGANIQYAWNTGETNTKFITISKNAVLSLQDLDFSSKTLYLQSDKTGIVEIQELF